MTQRSAGSGGGRGSGGPTDFDRFDGEIELDDPRPSRSTGATAPAAPPAAGDLDRSVGAAGAARRPTSGSGSPRVVVDHRRPTGPGSTATARVAGSPAGARGAWVLPLIGLSLLGLLGLLGHRMYCSYRANELRFAFHAQAQDLRQALLRLGHPPGTGDIGAAVARFAREVGVTLERVEPSIEPLDEVTINKLPQPTRIALGIASKLPNYRLPYAVIGFRARLSARYGSAEERFEAQHYTYFDSEPGGAVGTPGAGTPAAIGRQVEEQLQQRMKRALGPDAL